MQAPGRGAPPAAFVAAHLILALACRSGAEAAPEQSGSPSQRLTVRWTTDPGSSNHVAVEVSGLGAATLQELKQSNWPAAQWQRLLAIHADPGDSLANSGLPPMLGAYRIETGVLRFEPQFPLDLGVNYRAIFHPEQLPGKRGSETGLVTAVFQIPRPPASTTLVSQVYPSADVLPENLLKFYVHFSAPMSRGHIYDYIHLRDEAGKEIELPFLEIDEELWNPAMTRLTLFIDPGRIKRGVRPLEEVGPALVEGRRFTLVIDPAWRDGRGTPLRQGFAKTFKVGPPDREPPDPTHWKIQPPKSATRVPLVMVFPKPMDHALAERVIEVVDESGAAVEGEAKLENQERRWTFIPVRSWRPGAYKVAVQTTIEDLAGNNIGKPFEVDLFDGVEQRISRSTVKLAFKIR